jgi:WD40 repeat protein
VSCPRYFQWAALAALTISTARASEPVTALAFSPDGSVLVSNGPRRVDVRSAEDGTVKSQFACDLPKITSLAFYPHGKLLAVAGGEPGVRGEVRLFEWPAQKYLRQLPHPDDLVTSVAFNTDGTLLGVAGSDHTARVWRLADNNIAPTEAFTLTGHAGPVLAIAFGPGGRTIVTASADRSVKVWSAEDGHLLRTFSHHLEAVNALAFRPRPVGAGETAQPVCATASDDRTVRIWQPEIGRMVRIIRQHRAAVLALAYARDGLTIFSAGKEGIIRRFDADSDALVAEWGAHSDWIYSLAASPDGSRLASGDWSGNVRILELKLKK